MCQIISDVFVSQASSSACVPSFASNRTLTSSSLGPRTPDYKLSHSSFVPATSKGSGFRSHIRLHAACGHIDIDAPSRKSAFSLTSDLPPMLVDLQNDAINGENEIAPDRWMEESVCDIVRSINEAPFLHMVFDSKDVCAPATRIQRKRHRIPINEGISAEDEWKVVKDCVNRASPDGVILVHHLDDESLQDCKLAAESCMEFGNTDGGCSGGNSTDFWGILVLGKSIARSACYILKTTRVISSFGTCTGFCLSKAKCFGPSWHDQMQSNWLLGAEKSPR